MKTIKVTGIKNGNHMANWFTVDQVYIVASESQYVWFILCDDEGGANWIHKMDDEITVEVV